MRGQTLRTVFRLVLVGLVAGCVIVVVTLFVALRSSYVLNWLANGVGYAVDAQTVSLSPTLSGSISDLRVTRLGDDGLILRCASVTSTTSLDLILRGEVDSLVLQNPKLTFRIGAGKGAGPDLSFLARLPRVRRLEIQNAEARFPIEGGQHVELTGLNLTVKDFASKTGGSIAVQTRFAVTTQGDAAIAARGTLKGDFLLTAAYPRPYGTGRIEVVVDSGTYASAGRSLALTGLALGFDLAYDRPTETLALTRLRGESKELGVVEGAARVVMQGDLPWHANLSVASIDFAQVFGLLKPFLPQDYRTWTMQGQGAVATELQGTYAGDRPSLQGQVTFTFSQGGFSSPDSTTAAQGVSGRIILKLRYAPSDERLAVDLRTEQQDGEYLWRTFYGNLGGKQASLTAEGGVSLGGDRAFDLTGSLDVFQTGDYAFRVGGTRDAWVFQFTAAEVSHDRLLALFLRESLKDLSPRLADLSATGTSALEAVVRYDGTAATIVGTYRMAGATIQAPALPLALHEMAAHLPFDLVHPASAAGPAPTAGAPGFLQVGAVQGERLAVEGLRIPVLIRRNRLEVPEPVAVPFFGGTIQLFGIAVDDVLSADAGQFGVRIDGVDLGRLSRSMTGVEYPGTMDADFGLMRYARGRVTSQGKVMVRLFGGEVEAVNLFAERPASLAQRIGGDIAFRNINLEEITKRVAIGKMTGIVQGSLRDFVIEYGQPARFVLEVESVETPGVPQRISTDAIESISILGTGADSALNRGITRFFRDYPYRKIGFRCVLTNDQFSVNGTIHEGGTEYLVRRGFLRGVDVVNRNPENVISFKDMQERVGRLARPSQTEPVGVEVH
jgi:hypothetical protein